jgi:hypothetical protein
MLGRHVNVELTSALWWVNLLLLLNRSLLEREYTRINVLKALASINPMCILHVTTFLSKLRLSTLHDLQWECSVLSM